MSKTDTISPNLVTLIHTTAPTQSLSIKKQLKTVGPDAEIKRGTNFHKIAQKVAKAVSHKSFSFKLAQKTPNVLGCCKFWSHWLKVTAIAFPEEQKPCFCLIKICPLQRIEKIGKKLIGNFSDK